MYIIFHEYNYPNKLTISTSRCIILFLQTVALVTIASRFLQNKLPPISKYPSSYSYLTGAPNLVRKIIFVTQVFKLKLKFLLINNEKLTKLSKKL